MLQNRGSAVPRYCHCPGSLSDLVLAEISPVFRKRGEGARRTPVLSRVPFLPRARLLTKSPTEGESVLLLSRALAWPCFRRNHFRFQGERGGPTRRTPVLSRVPFLPRAWLLTKSPAQGGRTATAPVLCLTLFSPKSPPFSGREGRGHAVHPVLWLHRRPPTFPFNGAFSAGEKPHISRLLPGRLLAGNAGKRAEMPLFSGKIQES